MGRLIKTGFVVLVTLTVQTGSVRAQTQFDARDLELKLNAGDGRVRSQAPIPLDIELNWKDARLLEGYLELDFRETSGYRSDRILLQWRSPELAMSFGERRMRMLIPSLWLKSIASATAEARFVTANGVLQLGRHDVLVPKAGQRRFMIGLVLPETDFDIEEERVESVRKLDLEDMLDENLVAVMGDPLTVSVRVPADKLANSSLRLCVYDVIVLARNSLSHLRKSQLDALVEWIDAGGSLLVETDSVLDSSQAGFLRQLALNSGHDDTAHAIRLTDEGRLVPGWTDGDTAWWSPGLGRAIVTVTTLNSHWESQREWFEQAAWHLWYMRRDPVTPAKPAPQFQRTAQGGLRLARDGIPIRPAEQWIAMLNENLLPERVQSVPAWQVVTLLSLFLLAIGPGDYVLLGAIRRRTLTWIVFPAISLAFTWYAVTLAREHTGSTDFRTSLTVVDMVSGDRVVRRNRIELLFTATERESTIAENGEFFYPVRFEHTLVEDPAASYEKFSQLRRDRQRDAGVMKYRVEFAPPSYDGSLPGSYRVRRRMHQWSPELSRHTSIGPGTDDDPTFSWPIKDGNALSSAGGWECLLEHVADRYGENAVVFLTHGQRASRTIWSRKHTDEQVQAPPLMQLAYFVEAVSARGIEGIFHAVFRRPPDGHSSFEDLALIDPSDPHTAVAVVVVRDGDNYLAFRRVFRADDRLAFSHMF